MRFNRGSYWYQTLNNFYDCTSNRYSTHIPTTHSTTSARPPARWSLTGLLAWLGLQGGFWCLPLFSARHFALPARPPLVVTTTVLQSIPPWTSNPHSPSCRRRHAPLRSHPRQPSATTPINVDDPIRRRTESSIVNDLVLTQWPREGTATRGLPMPVPTLATSYS